MNSFRTPEANARYDAYRESNAEFLHTCVLCSREGLHEYTWWKIIENKFPYDRIASVHHMLIPKRHVVERELSLKERDELIMLKETALTAYQFLIEPTIGLKSIPGHFHIHLIVGKDIECG